MVVEAYRSVVPPLRAWLVVPGPEVPAPAAVRAAVVTARCLIHQADDARRADALGLLGLELPSAAPAAALAAQREALRLVLSAREGLDEPLPTVAEALQTPAGEAFCAAYPALPAVVLRTAEADLDHDPAALNAAVDALGTALEAELSVVEPSVRSRRMRAFLRLERTLLTVGLLALGAMGLRAVGLSMRTDHAVHAVWQASSAVDGYTRTGRGFHPIEGRFNIFFQTAVEAEPWVRFDLGAVRAVRAVRVQNRLDNHQDWAVPLILEVSTDGTSWRELARRVEPFYFWQATFRPTRVRWVRLRVPRPTSLQLGRVEIR